MIQVQQVTKRYGKLLANDHITFQVEDGQIAVLLGPNGAGKSTLITCITGLLRFEGDITLDGPVSYTHLRPIAVQNQFDILSRENAKYPGVFSYCASHGLSFVAWSPLAGGLLTGRYNQPQLAGAGDRLFDEGALAKIPAGQFEKVRALSRLAEELELSLTQLTLAYMLTLPGSGPVIPGASTVAQLEDNARAGKVTLSAEALQRVAEIVNG